MTNYKYLTQINMLTYDKCVCQCMGAFALLPFMCDKICFVPSTNI